MESEEDDECWDPKVRQAVSPISHVWGRRGDTPKLDWAAMKPTRNKDSMI